MAWASATPTPPDGRCISLLKVLFTNYCTYDCLYCVNRRSSHVPRAQFRVDELVQLTLGFYRRNYIEGLFLSSGIARSPDDTMEQLIAVVRELRETHRFRGYIHLKGIPDAAPELLDAAARYADRLLLNVELPTAAGLSRLAPEKRPDSIRGAMGHVRRRLLLRVPGLGTRGVERLLQARRQQRLGLEDVLRLCGNRRKLTPFIATRDWQPGALLDSQALRQAVVERPRQQDLFAVD